MELNKNSRLHFITTKYNPSFTSSDSINFAKGTKTIADKYKLAYLATHRDVLPWTEKKKLLSSFKDDENRLSVIDIMIGSRSFLAEKDKMDMVGFINEMLSCISNPIIKLQVMERILVKFDLYVTCYEMASMFRHFDPAYTIEFCQNYFDRIVDDDITPILKYFSKMIYQNQFKEKFYSRNNEGRPKKLFKKDEDSSTQESNFVDVGSLEITSKDVEIEDKKYNKEKRKNKNEDKNEDNNLCSICESRVKSAMVVPCGHAIMCKSCAYKICNTGKKLCPFCQCKIHAILKIFL